MNMNESILRTAKDSIKGLPLHYKEELAILEVRALNVNEDTIMEWLEDMYQFISDCEIRQVIK